VRGQQRLQLPGRWRRTRLVCAIPQAKQRPFETSTDNAIPGIRKFVGDEEFPDTGSMSNDASEPKL
jgi:hypothetical protein